MRYRLKIWILPFFFLLGSCVKIGEYYAGLNLQPNMTDSPFEPGLNVFGILKTGPGLDTINHYFEVQQLLDIASWDDEINLYDASIKLKRVTAAGEAFNYNLQHTADSLYANTAILTAPGDRWNYVCVYDTFEVTATCVVPNYPQLQEGTLQKEEKELKFTILADETAFMYQVYLIDGEHVWLEQKVPVEGNNTEFNLHTDWIISNQTCLLYIFAYDRHMEAYYTTSNTFFKPNAYRPPFSTVEGGYGTFGAVSSCLIAF